MCQVQTATTDEIQRTAIYNVTDDPERPASDADASEIQEWMESDFGRAVAEGMESAGNEDSREVAEGEIIDHERVRSSGR